MFLLGICPHCAARDRLIDEWDPGARPPGRRRSCMVCGFTLYWLNRNGTRYKPPEWSDEMAHIESRTNGAALNGITAVTLTATQRAMLLRAAQGMTNQQIAADSGRAVKTVKNDLCDVFAKLGASTRGEAVAVAVRSGVIPCPYCDQEA